jgi:hypothetical protein
MDCRRPLRAEQARQSQMHQEIAQFRRIENVCVIERGKCGHRGSEAEFLVVGREFRQRRSAFRIRAAFVSHHGGEANPPMSTYFAESDLAFIQKLNQRRAGNIERIGCFLSSQFSLHGNEGSGISLGHFLKNSHEHPRRGGRDLDRFAAATSDQAKTQRARLHARGENAAGFFRENRLGFGRQICCGLGQLRVSLI